MRAFVLPGIILGLALAWLGLRSYDALTRPDVPAQVQAVVQRYAPGIQIGATVRELRPRVSAPLTYVPHLGWVATLRDKTGVSQLRLLVSEQDRAGAGADGDRVDAVELVTASPDAYITVLTDLTTVFRRMPREGCLTTPEPGKYREVRLWTVGDDGGVALVNDFGGNTTFRHTGMVVVALLAYAGPFRGSATLRESWTARSCARLTGLAQ
jgi:hypothetical protein